MLNNVAAILNSGVAPAVGDYESIMTSTVGSGGASSITFSVIPSTYKHLQIRLLAQTNRGTYGIDQMYMRFNGDSGSNYSWHGVIGQGSGTPVTSANATQTLIQVGDGSIGTTTGGTFGAGVVDILDYGNTSKYKTLRSLTGVDINGTIAGYGGWIALNSGLWQSTSAISSIVITPAVGSLFAQYSHFALYGIKG